MALSRTSRFIGRSGSSHGTGTWVTSSFTPSANSLLVVALALLEDGGTTDPTGDATVSGGGLTFTKKKTAWDAGQWTGGIVIWTAPVGGSPSSMTLTFDCAARSIYNYVASVVDYTGYSTGSPTGAMGALSQPPGTLDGAFGFILDAVPLSGSEVFAALFSDTGNTSTPGTGWTEIHDNQQADGTGIQTQVRAAAAGAMLPVGSALGGTATTTSFTITTPAVLREGDLMELQFTHRGTGDGTVSDNSGDGVSWTRKGECLFAAGTFTTQHYYKRCTAAMAGGGDTITVTGLTNSCAGLLVVYRNAQSSGDPYRDWTTQDNASGTESHASVTTQANDWAVLVVGNSPDLAVTPTSPLVERAEILSTGGTDSSTEHASFQDTGGGGSGALAWTQTNAISGSIGYSTIPTTDNDRNVDWADVGVSGAVNLLALAAIEIKAASGTDLTVDNVSQAQSEGAPALTQDHSLSVASVAQAQSETAPALTQQHTLAGLAAVAQAQSVENVVVVPVINLVVAGVSQAQAATAPTLTQVHNLTVQNASQAQSAQALELTQQHSLAVQNATQAQKTEQPGPGPTLNVVSGNRAPDFGGLAGITTDVPHKIAINDFITVDMTDNTFDVTDREVAAAFYGPPNGHTLVYGNAGPADPDAGTGTVFKTRGVRVWLEQVHTLVVQNVAQAQTAENVTVTESGSGNLSAQTVNQAQSVQSPALTQVHTLVVQNAAQAQSATAPTVTQQHNVSPAALASAQSATSPALTQLHVLQPQGAAQAQSVQNVTIDAVLSLIVQAVQQAQSLGTVSLTQQHALLPAAIGQAQATDNVILFQAHTLDVDDVAQDQGSDAVVLSFPSPEAGLSINDKITRAFLQDPGSDAVDARITRAFITGKVA